MTPETAPVHAPRSVPDLLLGILGGGMILLAALSALVGGPSDGAGTSAIAAAPVIRIASPRDGAVLHGPLVLDFAPTVPLTRGPSGWMTTDGTLHLHMDLDGQELMPGPDDVTPGNGGIYRWAVPGVSRGPHTLRLLWSDAAHRPIAQGGSDSLRVQLR